MLAHQGHRTPRRQFYKAPLYMSSKLDLKRGRSIPGQFERGNPALGCGQGSQYVGQKIVELPVVYLWGIQAGVLVVIGWRWC